MISNLKANLPAFLIILTIATLLSLPLFKSGFYQIHDDQQIVRLLVFDQALKAGQFPVRWVNELGFGFGYPLFVFYPPLVYALAELFHLVGIGLIDAIKIDFFLSIILSGITMYFFVKQLGGKVAGVVASAFYMLTPYRAVDIYVRGALSEAFSFVWLPLILLSFYKLATSEGSSVVLAALSLGLLMLTHNLVALPFALLFPFYLGYLFLISQNKKRFIYKSIISIILAAGISAFFWMPSLAEKKFTIVDQMLLTDLANYKIHFAAPSQLWNSPWGYGGSVEGIYDGLSFRIGKLNLITSFLLLALILITLIRKSKNSPIQKGAVTFIALLLLSAFMTTDYSKIVWEALSPLAYLQFPWRFLIFTTLFSSIAAGMFIYYLKLPVVKAVVGFFIVLILIFTNFKLFRPISYKEGLTDQQATTKDILNWQISKTSFEYAPNGVKLIRGANGINELDLQKNELPTEKVQLVTGIGTINVLESKPQQTIVSADMKNQGIIKANIFNFPGWNLFIDGQKQEIDDNNKLKLITFPVSKGNHTIELKFENTPIRSLANTISLISLLILALLSVKRWPKISY
ncbi:glycosyltransferase family 39 protein [Candidatus Curtissbacteria bacterium]|nr:glycosyltransferase family 39 protein [Candidatus Curtissbacteria bacterium]